MQYAPLINASTKLGYIHRFLSQPITWHPTQSVKILLFLPKDFENQSSSITYPYISEFYYRKIVYSEKSPIFNIEKLKILEMRIEIDSKQSNRVSSHRNRESLPPFLSSVTGSRGYTTRSDNAATRFRWTSRPNPLEKRDYSRLIGTELWRNFEAALEGRAGADCRGSGFRPVASFLSLSLWHALLSTRALARKLNEALFNIYIYIYTRFAKWLATDRDGFYDRPV